MAAETDQKLVADLLEVAAGFIRTKRMSGTEKAKERSYKRHNVSKIRRSDIKRSKKAVTKRHAMKVDRAKARLGTKGGRFRLQVQSVQQTANLLEQFLTKTYDGVPVVD